MTPALQTPTKVPFKNVDTQSAPAFAVMQITGSIVEDGVTFLTCARAGSTLAAEYAINGQMRVYPGEKGVCHREGDVRALFDGDAVASGEGWGPRAGQWSLAKGYPGLVTAHGMHSAAGNVLYGKLAQLSVVLGAAGSDIPPRTGGTPGSRTVSVYVTLTSGLAPADPPMTFTGWNLSKNAIQASEPTTFAKVEGRWSSGGASETALVRFQLSDPLAYGVDPSGDNANIMTFTGGAYNADGGAIAVYDFTNDGLGNGSWSGPAFCEGWAIRESDSERYEIVWMQQQARWIDFTLGGTLQSTDASCAGCTVNAYWDGLDPDPFGAGVTVYNQSVVGGGYEFASTNGGKGKAVWDERRGKYWIVAMKPFQSRRFKCQLNGALGSGSATATIDTVSALDGGAAPASTPTSADNYLKLSGDDNAPGFIIEDWSGGGATPTYILESLPPVPGAGTLLFLATITGAFHKADGSASIGSVSSITDGVSAPSPTSAANTFRWAGNNGDPCLIAKNSVAGTYILLAVGWDLVLPVMNVFLSGNNLKQTNQYLIGKTNAASSDSTIDTGTNCDGT